MSRPSSVQRLPKSVLVSCGALSAFATLLLTAGMLAVMQPGLVPALAKPSIAWPLIIVGGMLESGAVTMLLSALRTRGRETGSEIR